MFLKKFVVFGLVGLLLFSLLSFTNAVAAVGDVIIFKVYEGAAVESRITISSKEKTTVINLEKEKPAAAIDKNSESTAKALEQYLSEGYKIETSNAVINSTYGHRTTTYILTK